MRKKQRQILRPPLHHIVETKVHTSTQSIRSIPKPDPLPTPLHRMRQIHILQHRSPHPTMPIHRKISLPFDHQKLPIGRSKSIICIIYLGHPVYARKLGKHQRHQRSLPETRHNLPRRIRQKPHISRPNLLQSPQQIPRFMHRIRVRKQQEPTPRSLRPKPASVRFPSKHAGFRI